MDIGVNLGGLLVEVEKRTARWLVKTILWFSSFLVLAYIAMYAASLLVQLVLVFNLDLVDWGGWQGWIWETLKDMFILLFFVSIGFVMSGMMWRYYWKPVFDEANHKANESLKSAQHLLNDLKIKTQYFEERSRLGIDFEEWKRSKGFK